MHDDVAEIKQYPVSGIVSFYLLKVKSCSAKLFLYVVGKSLYLASVCTARDDEIIGDDRYLTDIDDADIFRFFIL